MATHNEKLAISLQILKDLRTAGVQVIDLLGQGLRERRQVLKEEARQLRQDWQESETLRGQNPSQTRPNQSPTDEPAES